MASGPRITRWLFATACVLAIESGPMDRYSASLVSMNVRLMPDSALVSDACAAALLRRASFPLMLLAHGLALAGGAVVVRGLGGRGR